MNFESISICPEHKLHLESNEAKDILSCPNGCLFPKVRGIFRFVENEKYASSFGIQWNAFRLTQLDSFTGIPISRERLKRIAGGSLEIFHGKDVLEAGCGAGRFTEVLLESGANVFAIDISNAVDANFENCNKYPNYFVCQADILNLPVTSGQFDIVVCIGVIQHTPDPDRTIQALCSYLKPGGLLFIDHYTYGYAITPSRKRIRDLLLRKNKEFALRYVQSLTYILWPVHIVLYKVRNIKGLRKIRDRFLVWSPVVDYQDAYPALGAKLLYQWALLDTHDTLTDHFKHLRSAEEIQNDLQFCGMTNIQTEYAGNGVEARAKKPFPTQSKREKN